jgi:hypothetical protein
MVRKYFIGLVAFLVGCGQYPDPNDVTSVLPEERAGAAYQRLEAAGSTLEFKVQANEISDARRIELLTEFAEDLLKKIDPKGVSDSDQWMYAALLRVTGRWVDAEASLKIAVKAAQSEDRRVNDSLKLSQAQAKNNEVIDAIATATTVLNAGDSDAAPILPAVLLEIVPAAKGRGHDVELAGLLEKAIECHQRVKVDMTSEAGKSFVIASRYHINRARKLISELNASGS